MDWSKINPHKTKIIAGSVVVAAAIGAGTVFYGVKPIAKDSPTNTANQTAQPPATEPTVVDLKIKGNKSSRIYHLPNCPNYNDIAERNIIWFKTREEAEARKFRVAKNCP